MIIKKLLLVTLLIASISLPYWGGDYLLFFFLYFFLYLAFAQMWNLLVGFSGLLSLGQQAFIGFSGYTVAVLTDYYTVNIWLSILLGGVFSVLLALFMSLFIFRMKGVYFAIGTWIFSEILVIVFGNWEYVKYGTGMYVKVDPSPSMLVIYFAALFVALACFIIVWIILRSKIGLGLMAIRDDEKAAETIGINILRSKLFCFLVSAFLTGITSGVLYTFQIFIEPTKVFSINWTVILCFIVIIGGIGTVEGPFVGALIYVLLSQWLSEYTQISMIIMGGIAILIMLIAPRGIVGTLEQKIGFSLLSPRRT